MRTSDESWRALRRRRANQPFPSGVADADARCQVFQTALEQAEQQFRAAASTGYESRALNLFYGLSQAGRAIAAVLHPVTNSFEWCLRGHGLRLEQASRAGAEWDLLKLEETTADRSSFYKLSQLLGSPAVANLPLSTYWQRIPEPAVQAHTPQGSTAVPLLVRMEQPLPFGRGLRAFCSFSLPQDIASLPSTERPPLRQWLGRYPGLSTWETHGGMADAWPDLNVRLSKDITQAAASTSASNFARYRSHLVAIPRVHGEAGARHPLMLWWATLFGLSVLTRYEPVLWSQAINVDSSAAASTIEVLLDAALDAVPELIDEVLDL